MLAVLISCNQKPKQVSENYKPGFGEFMSSVQAHHIKLWFAGINENWPLADFEVQEIMELVDDIQKFETDREETKLIVMIKPALDSLNSSIQQQNLSAFKSKYENLTVTCNQCHVAAKFEFNQIKIPDHNPFSNQVFSLKE